MNKFRKEWSDQKNYTIWSTKNRNRMKKTWCLDLKRVG